MANSKVRSQISGGVWLSSILNSRFKIQNSLQEAFGFGFEVADLLHDFGEIAERLVASSWDGLPSRPLRVNFEVL